MYNRFEDNIQKIKNYLEEKNTPIVRILYTEDSGRLSSLSIPATKIISSTTHELMSILTIQDKLLYPDTGTSFVDPTSVQENLCIIGNFIGDRRDGLDNKQMEVNTTININLINNTIYDIDLFHDLRNELIIESIKAGINMISHYTTDNKIQSFCFNTMHLLDLADSIQKMKFLINCIVGSYGQGLNITDDDNKILFRTGDNKTIIQSIKTNPYLYVKHW